MKIKNNKYKVQSDTSESSARRTEFNNWMLQNVVSKEDYLSSLKSPSIKKSKLKESRTEKDSDSFGRDSVF